MTEAYDEITIRNTRIWIEKKRRERQTYAIEGIPARYKAGFAAIDNLNQPEAARACREWCEQCADAQTLPEEAYDERTIKGLWISGSVGTGKTALAWAMLQDLRLRGVDVEFVDWSRWLVRIRESYRRDSSRSEESLICEAASAPVLILDDLGSERPSLHALMLLLEILKDRYGALKPVIVTSNLEGETIQALWEKEIEGGADLVQRVISRLSQMVVGLSVDGYDRRKRLAKKT